MAHAGHFEPHLEMAGNGSECILESLSVFPHSSLLNGGDLVDSASISEGQKRRSPITIHAQNKDQTKTAANLQDSDFDTTRSVDKADSFTTALSEPDSFQTAPESFESDSLEASGPGSSTTLSVLEPSIVSKVPKQKSTPLNAATPFDSLDLVNATTSSSQEKINSYLAMMSHPDNKHRDLFDSETWDPNLASLSPPDKSPEPVTIKPQPVAYTTVGSLVNTRAAPQFSAPNRIQREGAQRKSLLAILQNYEASTLNNPRGPPPSLNGADSMRYAQQYGRSGPQSTSSSQSVPTNVLQPITNLPVRPTLPDVTHLSDDDLRVLLYSLGHRLLKENEDPLTSTLTPMTAEDAQNRWNNSNSSGLIQGLEKMQTVQRLSRFPNPMQNAAKHRLSELSVARSQADNNFAHPNLGSLRILDDATNNQDIKFTHPEFPPPGKRLGDIAKERFLASVDAAGGLSNYLSPYTGGQPHPSHVMFDNDRYGTRGELDRGYGLPHACPATPSGTQVNPLYGAYGAAAQSATVPIRSLGYPQPLTAGPPGQRQYIAPSSFISGTTSTEDLWSSDFAAAYNPLLNGSSYNAANTYSPWASDFIGTSQYHPSQTPIFAKTGFDYSARTKIVDTISPQDAAKYFPNGFPSDMTGEWTPPTEQSLRRFGELPPLTPKELATNRQEGLEAKHEYGYRRFVSMKYEDYENEYEARQKNPLAPIAPPLKCRLTPTTIEEINKKPLAEVAAPFIEAALGNLLSYKDHTPGSRFRLSQWREAKEDLIDRSKDGNKSFFDEDRGAPPKSLAATTQQSILNSQVLAAKNAGGK